jgi:hypothetical protein
MERAESIRKTIVQLRGHFQSDDAAQAGAGGRGAGRATPDVTISRSSIPEH